MRSVWFLLIFPTAYFLHVGDNEALFLALALGCILAARVERWWLAGILGAFCSMTRAAGIVLVPKLAVEAAQQYLVRSKLCRHGAARSLSTVQIADVDRPHAGGYSTSPNVTCAWNWRWLWIAMVPAGFVIYLVINWSVTGDPFAFLQTRQTSFEQSFASPLAGNRRAIWAQYPTPREAEMVGAQELFFAGLGLSVHLLVGSSCALPTPCG